MRQHQITISNNTIKMLGCSGGTEAHTLKSSYFPFWRGLNSKLGEAQNM